MMLKIFTILVLCLFVFPGRVHAYLDPGTGSYLFQFLIAGLLGGMFFFRGYFDKIKNKLTGKKEKKESDEKTDKTSKTKK